MKRKFKVTVDDETFLVEVEEIDEGGPGAKIEVVQTVEPTITAPKRIESSPEEREEGVVTAPLPGVVTEIRVTTGDQVEEGSVLIMLEAMKMENEIYAPIEGVVREVYIEVGNQVGRGDRLVLIS